MTIQIISEWAEHWGIPRNAVNDLISRVYTPPIFHQSSSHDTLSESDVTTKIQVSESMSGARMWRNNVGVAFTTEGTPIRYGLANVSKKMNLVLKSADLIGIKPTLVTGNMVGSVIGVFQSIEAKKSDWVFRNTTHEQAQVNWRNLVISLGGIAKFSNGEEYE